MASYHIKASQYQHRARAHAAPRRIASSRHLLLLLCQFSLACWLTACGSKPDNAADSAAPSAPATNAPAAAAVTRPEYARLLGKWERPDGDYILEIKSIDNSGVIEAGYFNPDPIHVSKAAVFQQDGGTKLFIELRDVNYPGCTYSLGYDPQTDRLSGQYFQAAAGQTYEITFVRLK